MDNSLIKIGVPTVISAIAAIVGVVINNRQQRKSTLILEKVKLENQIKKEQLTISENEREAILVLIQKMKAIIDLVKNNHTDREKLIEYHRLSEDLLFDFNIQYGKMLSRFSEKVSDTVHRCKDFTSGISKNIIRLTYSNSEEQKRVIRDLDDIRESMSTFQKVIIHFCQNE